MKDIYMVTFMMEKDCHNRLRKRIIKKISILLLIYIYNINCINLKTSSVSLFHWITSLFSDSESV